MMTDPIADMLTRIRNAQAVRKETVVVPYSNVKRVLAELLVREGWIARCEEQVSDAAHRADTRVAQALVLTLRYDPPGVPVIHAVRRISKPGRRVYVSHGGVPTVKRGAGMVILSTPKGMMTNREAKRAGIGGEVVCEVY